MCSKVDEAGIDWLLPSPGSVLALTRVVLLDPLCTHDSSQLLQRVLSAPPLVAGQRRNRASLLPEACVQLPPEFPLSSGGGGAERRCFPAAVSFEDAWLPLISTNQQGQVEQGGAVHLVNSTRVCASYLDAECLRQHSNNASYCWQQQAEPQLLEQPEQATSSGSAAALSAGAIAGIAVAGATG